MMLNRITTLSLKGQCEILAAFAKRYYKDWPESRVTDRIYMPPDKEDRLLPLLPYTPQTFPNEVQPYKYPRKVDEMRGPERIHNQLIYRQYGIMALSGGSLRGAHFDVIRDKVNKHMDTERFFAIWRIDPPWKPTSKKSLGKKMGGGKCKVHHYETPVRAGRVLIEIAGIGEYEELLWILDSISKKLPLFSMPVSQNILDGIKQEKLEIDAKNYNPFEYRKLVRENYANCQLRLSPKEGMWGGTYF